MTFNGKHTVNELAELVNDIDWQVNALSKTFVELSAVPSNIEQDPSLPAAWAAFVGRWDKAKDKAKTAILMIRAGSPFTSWTMVTVLTCEQEYQDVLHATAARYPSWDPGDLPDVRARINAIKPITYLDRPPSATVDIDLNAYIAADKLKKAGEKAAGDFVADNWGKIAVGGIAAVGALIIAKKSGLL